MISLKFISEELNQTRPLQASFTFNFIKLSSLAPGSRYCYLIEAKITSYLCLFLSSSDRFFNGPVFFCSENKYHNLASHFLFTITSIIRKATAFSLAHLGQVLWGSRSASPQGHLGDSVVNSQLW